MAWLIQWARLTLFVTPEAERIEAPDWQALVGSEPENKLQRRGAPTVEDGPFESGRLQLQTNQSIRRIDLQYSATPTEETVYATLGSMDEVLEHVRAPWERLLRSGIETVRIALVMSHLQPATDADHSRRLVQEALGPTHVSLQNARDFMYRINRPRESKVVERLVLNRLATWSSVMLQRVLFNMLPGEASRSLEQAFAAALETDFSTVQERREPIATSRLLELLDELQELTAELAARGDVP